MFRRILKITTPIILIGIILFIGYKNYKKTQNSTNNPITVIPTNASAILQINDVSRLNRALKISGIWEKLQNINQVKSISQKAEEISKFFLTNKKIFYTNELFISYHKVGPNNHAVLYCATFNKENITSHENPY